MKDSSEGVKEKNERFIRRSKNERRIVEKNGGDELIHINALVIEIFSPLISQFPIKIFDFFEKSFHFLGLTISQNVKMNPFNFPFASNDNQNPEPPPPSV
jgi:hypothetical protein